MVILPDTYNNTRGDKRIPDCARKKNEAQTVL
jgi:hypothetical protein